MCAPGGYMTRVRMPIKARDPPGEELELQAIVSRLMYMLGLLEEQ